MRIFVTKPFSRFARKAKISDVELIATIPLLEANDPDANLGGDVFKMQVARPDRSKKGGFRVIVCFRKEKRTFFVYGFAKSERDNIDDKELVYYKKLAKLYLGYTEQEIETALKAGTFREIGGLVI
jgi:hypothetical protein